MTDRELRDLERRAQTGDAQAEAAWWVARARRGESLRLELLAWSGHAPAREALDRLGARGEQARRDAWTIWDEVVEAPDLATFLQGWGSAPLGQATWVLARHALAYLEAPDAWEQPLQAAARRLAGARDVTRPDPPPPEQGYYGQLGARVCGAALDAAFNDDAAMGTVYLLDAIDALQPDSTLAGKLREGLAEHVPHAERPPALAALLGDPTARAALDPPLSLFLRLRGLAPFGALGCAQVSLALDLTVAERCPDYVRAGPERTAAWRDAGVAWLRHPEPSAARALIAACEAIGLRGLARRVLAATGGSHPNAALFGLSDHLRVARRQLHEAGVGDAEALLAGEVRRWLVFAERGGEAWSGDPDDDYVWRLHGPWRVVRAHPEPTDRPLSLVLDLRHAVHGETRRGFLLEESVAEADARDLAALSARIDHPALPRIEACLALEGPHPGRLALIAPAPPDDARPLLRWSADADPAERVGCLRQLAAALEAYRAAGGPPDRELHPRRILVTPAGQPWLDLHGVLELAPLTDGAVVLPQGWLEGAMTRSPERLLSPVPLADPRVDVYALGILLYRMLADAWPFDFAGEEGARAVGVLLDARPAPLGPRVPDLPPAWVAAVERAIARDPAARWADPAAFAAALS